MAKTKKAGLLTKLVVLALLVYLSATLLDLRGRIVAVQSQRDILRQEVALQSQRNAELTDDVNNSLDPDHLKNVAREKLGLVEPGEKVFVFIN